ncbi:MAG: rhomboid family intramembrane serine protease [Streptococcaceae bacterium]|jgi:membrane associated rhomboid family serine protease|nr:rhomboid family intramembrane serine protease [Streptococcaceae bacterium]
MNDFIRGALELKYKRQHLATYVIVGVTLLYWLAQLMTFGTKVGDAYSIWSAGGIFGYGMLQSPATLWRLITPVFVHYSWGHVLGNLLILFIIGRLIEQIFGSVRFVLIYFLSSIFANAAVFALNPSSLSAGASSAIFGVFGAIAALGYFTSDPRIREVSRGFVALIILVVFLNFFQAHISIIGHIGGAIGGALLGTIFAPKDYARFIPLKFRQGAAIVLCVLFLLFISVPYFI